MPASDEEVLQRCVEGDERAFVVLIERHLDALHAFLARRCPRWSLVEEVAQEVWVRIWEHAGRFRGDSTVRTWIFGIARNVLSERLRTEPRGLVALDAILAMPGDADSDEADPGDQADSSLAALRLCLEQVPPRARDLLAARYRDGRALSDLARAYKKNTTALAREIQRLAAALRTCIQGRMA